MDRLLDAPILGCGVNIGAGAKILGRVRIGDGALIGANSVVLEDVPAGAVAVGIPAKIVERPRGPTLKISDQKWGFHLNIGLIAIGRNEGDRLRRCLRRAALT